MKTLIHCIVAYVVCFSVVFVPAMAYIGRSVGKTRPAKTATAARLRVEYVNGHPATKPSTSVIDQIDAAERTWAYSDAADAAERDSVPVVSWTKP